MKHDPVGMDKFEAWMREVVMGKRPPMPRKQIDPKTSKVLHVMFAGPDEEAEAYEVMACYNFKKGTIDLAATYTGIKSTGRTIPLVGAVFDAKTSDGELIRIPEEIAGFVAEPLATSFAESVHPHLEFLLVVRLFELTYDSLPPGLDFKKLVGTLGFPKG